MSALIPFTGGGFSFLEGVARGDRKINPPGKLHRQADAGEVVLCGLPDFA
jgi:hypothetical protein